MFRAFLSRVKHMSELFSTELIPASDRLDAWRSQATQVCGNSRFQFPRQRLFRGLIERRSVGALQLTQFSSTPVSFAKYPTVNANSGDRGCIIISQLQGQREYCQGGNRVTLEPGDTTLIDAGKPWSSICADQCSRLYMRLPRWLVQEKLEVRELPVVRCISGKSGLGATLFRLATSLYQEAGVLSVEEGVAAVEAYLHMLRACIGSVPGQEISYVPAISDRVQRCINARLADPNLKICEIAAEAGISLRHLHRLFLKKGITAMKWIQQKRLENCRSELSDPRLLERSITEIAFSWGFSDSAHFSHCFKKQFGISPREFRSRVLEAYPGGNQSPSLSAKGRAYPN